MAVTLGDDAHSCHIPLLVSLQVTETGPRDVASAARPTGRALLCLSTYSIRVDKIETRLVTDNARLYNTIQYNTIVWCLSHSVFLYLHVFMNFSVYVSLSLCVIGCLQVMEIRLVWVLIRYALKGLCRVFNKK